jgi:hypothetical protein
MRLPIAVPSTGPAKTSSPVASAVSELRYLSWLPPPTMLIDVYVLPAISESRAIACA